MEENRVRFKFNNEELMNLVRSLKPHSKTIFIENSITAFISNDEGKRLLSSLLEESGKSELIEMFLNGKDKIWNKLSFPVASNSVPKIKKEEEVEEVDNFEFKLEPIEQGDFR
ncbi:MAG: hypothetical protein GY714_09060 [Desulfobacterales bacterium]|nr:hypothetical protein [Desulfobacterales bacterium]